MATNDFPIDKQGYITFDALSIKQHIKDRLTKSGVWTDHNYEGSYLSNVIDIVAYTFNVLIFYLNKTSTESMFSEAQIYENMNRVVKMLDYKPVGKQTSTLAFEASALGTGETSSVGLYTIPRYSYIDVNGIPYSFNEDITFAKSVSGETEFLSDLSQQKLLYQGSFQEYPVYTAIGQENEVMFLTPGDNISIDHFNVHVYVKPVNQTTWEEWEQTPSLYLENSGAKKYEVRYNENKHYEIKFGNDINGIKLNAGDQIAVYYLKSNGKDGEIAANSIDGKSLIKFSSLQFNQLIIDVVAGQYSLLNSLDTLQFVNNAASTYFTSEESVDSIRSNAPGLFRSQYRLVTEADYENYVKSNFANLMHDVKVTNNWRYLSEYIKYYYDLGLNNPDIASRPLYNQVLFADACNFNNVYITAVPKTVANIKDPAVFLAPSQKELIISSMRSEKTLTTEVIISDPIYIAVAIGIENGGLDLSILDNSQLVIIKDSASRRDSASVQNDVANVLINYFDKSNIKLGQEINVKQITADILSVNGVKTFYTRRTDVEDVSYEGLSLLVWNPIYPTVDIDTTTKNTTLSYFKYPYLYNKDNIINYIVVQSESRVYEGVEY